MFQRKIRRENHVKERERLLLTYCRHVHLSWSFVLSRFCVLTWVTKILMRDILNILAGRRFPTTAFEAQFVSEIGSKDRNNFYFAVIMKGCKSVANFS